MTTGRPSSSADRHRVHRAAVAGERVADRGAGGQVPHPHRPVVAAGDDHRPAVQLRDRHRVHRAAVAGERVADRGAGGQVPHPHRLVVAAGDDHRAGHPAPPPPPRAPAPSWPVNGSPTGAPVARSHTRTVRSSLPEMTTGRPSSSADRHRVHRAAVAGERVADRGAGGQVPHPHRPVVAAGDDHRAGRPAPRPPPRRTAPSWPVNGSPTGVPVARSHTRTVPSSLPEMTTGRPSSSAAATARTAPPWPVNGSPTGAPVARSHTRTVPSSLPEMTTGPAVQLRGRHRRHRAVVAGDLLVGALQLPGCPSGTPRAGEAVGVDAVGEGFGSSASCGQPEVGRRARRAGGGGSAAGRCGRRRRRRVLACWWWCRARRVARVGRRRAGTRDLGRVRRCRRRGRRGWPGGPGCRGGWRASQAVRCGGGARGWSAPW